MIRPIDLYRKSYRGWVSNPCSRICGGALEAQADTWILQLYEFLNGQPALRRRVDDLPVVRTDDGTHVRPRANGQPNAFLPGPIETGFPTVRASVCATDEARKFLESLGLTKPDPVDDVVWNVLPRYGRDDVDVSDADYDGDIRRILAAFGTDSKAQREKLLGALRKSSFVIATDAGDGSKCVSTPGDVYVATDRLKGLFDHVAGVLLVDDSYPCLRGEDVREMLEACGATRYLQTVAVDPGFTREQRREMRVAAGCGDCSSEEVPEDHTLRGLDAVLGSIATLDAEARAKKAALLWEALADVQDRRGTGTFSGAYRWTYYHRRSASFDAAFVRRLNETAWVPDGDGNLQQPEFVVFERLGWKTNPVLLSKIRFKPPIIETLAKAAGIESGVLDLLKKLGVTSVAELKARLGDAETESEAPIEPTVGDVDDAISKLLGDVPVPTPPVPDPAGSEQIGPTDGRTRTIGSGKSGGSPAGAGTHGGVWGAGPAGEQAPGTGSRKRTSGGTGARPFISYVGAHPEEGEPDPDGLDQGARMALEKKAIELILGREPQLQRTPPHNPGYDLTEPDGDSGTMRWIEVKAMTGGLHDRPVGLSHTQFECAREHGGSYWLYVVEHAADDEARIIRIQDPARKARTFTFDHGWMSIAEPDSESATHAESRDAQ